MGELWAVEFTDHGQIWNALWTPCLLNFMHVGLKPFLHDFSVVGGCPTLLNDMISILANPFDSGYTLDSEMMIDNQWETKQEVSSRH